MKTTKCRFDKILDLSELKTNPRNPNQHSELQIKMLAKIMEYQGVRAPIVISKRSGLMTKGHGRMAAAKQIGWTKFPVEFQDYESDEQEYADMVADNEIARLAKPDNAMIIEDAIKLGKNFDFDLLGIPDFQLPTELPPGDEDAIPEKVEPKTKLGDLYQLGEHRLLCGDSTKIEEVERLMNGEKADLWLTDPPYGVDYVAKNAAVHGGMVKNAIGKEIKNDTKTVKELCPFWRDVAANAYVVSTEKASNYWFACQGSDKMMMMMMMMMDEAGWNIRHELIWVKKSFVFGRSDYHYRHEPIIYGWKKTGKHEWCGDRKQDSVFEIDRPHKSDLHPTTKPVELLEKLISNSTKQKQKVLDTFGGSGSTMIACEKLGRSSYLMELDPHYCDVIVARWEKYTGKKAQLLTPDKTQGKR